MQGDGRKTDNHLLENINIGRGHSVSNKKVNFYKGAPTSQHHVRFSSLLQPNMHQEKSRPPVEVEKWAGPSFINSPHPSCLPLPQFFTNVKSTTSYQVSAEGTRRQAKSHENSV